MTVNDLLDKAAAELCEEILSCPEGTPWFYVIRAKLTVLANDLKDRQKKTTYVRTEGLNQ